MIRKPKRNSSRFRQRKQFTVRYEAVNAMLLNEFLKQHRKIDEQDRKIEEQEAAMSQAKIYRFKAGSDDRRLKNQRSPKQQKRMEVVIVQLKEQAAQIQKVSAALEASKPAPQTVSNP